jgi:GntR family histidine utilization transcriptional repressor
MQSHPDQTTFQEVRTEILRRITNGPWCPGTPLPGEVELAEAFGCSRTAINRALREIISLGCLDRKHNAGTCVRLAPLRQARFEMPLVRAEIKNSGATYRYILIAQTVCPPPPHIRKRLGLKTKTSARHLVCLHHADDIPFQLEDRWISLDALPSAIDQDFSISSPNEWLAATVPFSEGEVVFCAIGATDLMVKTLGHTLGAPVFCLERATFWQGAPLTFVVMSHNASHRMITRY